MPVPAPDAARRRPTCLVVAGGDNPADLIAWLDHARTAFDATAALWPADSGTTRIRRACARLGVPFVALSSPVAAAAVIGSRAWDCVEVGSTLPELRVSLLPGLRTSTGLRVLGTDDPTLPAEFINVFDLVLCSSAGVVDRLAASCPGLGTVRLCPFPAEGAEREAAGTRRLATIRAALAEKAVRGGRPSGRTSLLQVTPQRFGGGTQDGVARYVGGGERYVANLCRAVRLVDSGIACQVVSAGEQGIADAEGAVLLAGDPARPDSFDPAAVDAVLGGADVVHVHQCLTRFGLFAAARARMLGCRVIGTDHGGGRAPFLASQPHLAQLFDVVQTYSAFGDVAAMNLPVRTVRLPGPVDDEAFALSPDPVRDPSLLLVLGRILPHKGIEAVIDALPASIRLVVAGRAYDLDYASFLRARAKGRPVRFEPDLDDNALRELMAQAGLCVQASVTTDYLGRPHPWAELLGLAPLECMCTGMPAIVTRAGALGELGNLPGCDVAGPDEDLAGLLRRHADSTLPHPAGRTIREAAVRAYGLRQFGQRYLSLVDELVACAS